ncbi:MAG: helix-turn-helix domain-containing protein [Pseudomonadota bacterium]
MVTQYEINTRRRSLCAQIKARRQTLNMTQDDLAAALETIRKRVADMENGKASVKLALALQACTELGLFVGVREA